MFKNYDTIICPNSVKEEILKKITLEKKLINIKFYTLEEFKKNYFGTYKIEAIYYLMKKNNYKYEVAKTYLDNFYFIEELKKELEEHNLIEKKFIKINRIFVIGYFKIDKYVLNEIKKYDCQFIDEKENNYKNKVYEFKNIIDEVNFVIYKIEELLKTTKISNIFLVNVGEEYIKILKRQLSFYNLPINLNEKKSIYGTKIVKEFLKNLKNNKEIVLNDDEISNSVKQIVNKYSFTDIDDIIIECIEYEIKNTYITSLNLENALNVTNIDSINNDNYYFVLNFSEGSLPVINLDDDFLSDKTKQKYGILTSIEKNRINKNKVINKIQKEKVIITYNTNNKYQSSIIQELGMEVIKENKVSYNSNLYNKIRLATDLDNLIKYNIKTDELNFLYSNYKNIEYQKYSNKFTKIDKKLFNEYINNLSLSYSSMDNFYKCSFKYYLNDILKLNEYEEKFSIYIGNLFHYILSIYKNDNFDFEIEFNNYIKEKELTKKEKFFINKLKKDLLFVLDVIKKFDTYTELNDEKYEEKIYINKDKNIKITFKGFIDKIKFKEDNDKTYVAVIDYKTYDAEISIDKVKYGLGMQLPVYLYLVKNSKIKNPVFVGFYLQKILHNREKDSNNYNEEKLKKYKLEGYSNSNQELLRMFDKNYEDSLMIKSLKLKNDGEFNSYSKIISNEEIEELIKLTEDKVDEAINNILECNFDINPKVLNGKLIGCEYCKYGDICFKTEEDKIVLE